MAIPFPSFRVWPVPFTGGVLGFFVASWFEVDGAASGIFMLGGALPAYLIWCAFVPLVRCWVCRADNFITDGMGGMRERPCVRCKRRRLIRRPGARLIGAIGRRE